MATELVSPIRTIRKARGLTAEHLAFRAGLSSATVYRAERGIGTPEDDTLKAIAQVLGVGVSELHDPDASDSSENAPLTDPTPHLPPSGYSRNDGAKDGAR